jgi:hypothetical protein
MKYVTSWGIIDDDNLLQIPSQLVQIFDVVASMIDARFAEETRSEDVPSAKKVKSVTFCLVERKLK